MHPKFMLNPRDASEKLENLGIRAAPRTLANLRWRGGGPAYVKDVVSGSVMYPMQELEKWASARRRLCRSTSDPGTELVETVNNATNGLEIRTPREVRQHGPPKL